MLKVFKWIGIVLLGLVGLIVISGFLLFRRADGRLSETVTVPAETIPIPSDSAAIARGRHVSRAIAKCVECHGDDLGGGVMIDDPAFGRVVAPNLTRGAGGVGADRTDEDLVRAIRHAVGAGGRKLVIMPSAVFNYLSADDVGAVVAYVRSMPPVDRELPPHKFGPILRMLVATGQMPASEAELIDHSTPARPSVPEGATVEYGRYIAEAGGCRGCHGDGYSGGKVLGGDPSWPAAANITPAGLVAYDEAAFTRLLREGIRPSGSTVNAAMPVRLTREMTDTEIKALWMFLQTLPPREFGNR
jgi:mono/diheme cytochrome c family protein